MELSPVTARLLAVSAFVLEDVELRPGAEVVARVVQAQADGRGLLSLAGRHVLARLPAGLLPGQRLELVVVGRDAAGNVVLRVRHEGGTQAERAELLARLAGALAASGDGELLRAALNLADPVAGLPLPQGGAVTLAVDPEAAGGEEGDAGAGSSARLVLHSPHLGPIELDVSLDPGGVRVRATLEAGEAVRAAEEARGELAAELAGATGRPATVDVSARGPGATRPPRPPVLPPFDAYA